MQPLNWAWINWFEIYKSNVLIWVTRFHMDFILKYNHLHVTSHINVWKWKSSVLTFCNISQGDLHVTLSKFRNPTENHKDNISLSVRFSCCMGTIAVSSTSISEIRVWNKTWESQSSITGKTTCCILHHHYHH